MEIKIDHKTEYAYSEPNKHSIQYIRLTPYSGAGQSVQNWTVDAGRMLHVWRDGFGNIVHTMIVHDEHDILSLKVQGVIQTTDTGGVTPYEGPPSRALFLLQPTELTEPSDRMRELLADVTSDRADDPIEFLHALMTGIRKDVAYVPGETDVDTTAAEALEAGRGVCQDHAHLFTACARLAGFPARYVSGYLCATEDGNQQQASHAWAETLVPDLGWVAFDPANGVSPHEGYVRVALGRDYADAAPVRGIRTGAGEERLAVRVAVTDMDVVHQQ
ncbi:MAG: transglutaminase domain-containing protein [Alphaproteobacteria bacterium]